MLQGVHPSVHVHIEASNMQRAPQIRWQGGLSPPPSLRFYHLLLPSLVACFFGLLLFSQPLRHDSPGHIMGPILSTTTKQPTDRPTTCVSIDYDSVLQARSACNPPQSTVHGLSSSSGPMAQCFDAPREARPARETVAGRRALAVAPLSRQTVDVHLSCLPPLT